ncbi:hypothetical protein COCSADRAFT_132671 [Bipolaris sorokiniana ND90Pr]|uniref:Rhodopsin domain-containing protein n=1 Tax=Cochliobolus sativus (strain ND90Pr / ATCC 201652) TaxID=665912 RepID=M2SSD9_COCSN|nr:uncharacterized protein COCSADRAFT_132671 [Bipolaris sorokiniana ND90Pr]EMD70118.1 hypothetical protein COCSADRAFT_132671 [Bipolaris sorokiniana ND90Pr]
MTLPFNQESWIWYTCAVCMIGARLISRKILFRSIKGLQFDDCIMGLFVTAAYTVLLVFSNRWLKVDSNLEPPGFDFGALSPEELSRRVYGSKLVVVVEQMQIAVLWSCKACLLIMYHRITRTALHYENIAIKVLAVYTAIGFVIIEALYFSAWCRPFSAYYAVPTSSLQCTTLVNHRITKAVFSISSDLSMLFISLPMLVRSLLPMKRKIILCAIFSLGLFVVIASIANAYSSFTHPYKATWISWYVRESSTAILVANLPFTWNVLREIFEVGQFDASPPPAWTYHSARTARGRTTTQLLNQQMGTTNRTYATSTNPSRTRRSTSLVMSTEVVPPKNSHQSEDARTDLMEEAIRLQDFAPVVLRSTNDGVRIFDLESGLVDKLDARTVLYNHTQQRNNFMTVPQTIIQDGNGGFYIDGRPMSSPSMAHITVSSKRTSANSVTSLFRRPTSPVPSHSTTKTDAEGERNYSPGNDGGEVMADKGRDAMDAKPRWRMME